MGMGWVAWSQSPTWQNAQLTCYDCQSRIKNGHGMISLIMWPTCKHAQLTSYDCQSRIKNWHSMISMITVTNMAECTTHFLWLPEQDKEWIWDDQHDHSHQHVRTHNSLSMIARAGQRMVMGWSVWSQSPTSQNAQLTHYDFQGRIKNGHGMIRMIMWPTCPKAQLTSYDCQSRIKNGHGVISMITVTNMSKCTTHCLWLPEQDKEWTWDDQHGHSHQHTRMHNLPTMIARAG